MLLTFALAVIGWIIFRTESMGQAADYFKSMVSNPLIDFSMLYSLRALLGFTAIMMIVEWLQREKVHALQLPDNKVFKYGIVRWSVYYALIILINTYSVNSQTFIYFQF